MSNPRNFALPHTENPQFKIVTSTPNAPITYDQRDNSTLTEKKIWTWILIVLIIIGVIILITVIICYFSFRKAQHIGINKTTIMSNFVG